MSLRVVLAFIAAAVAGGLASCDDEGPAQAMPAPRQLSDEAIGYYCNMIVAEHPGPKGQVILTGAGEPLWFSSVRDTLAFTLLPEEPRNIAAIYVNDMARADWNHPEAGTWVEARAAWYVLDSGRTGGMGAPELVPFGDEPSAQRFAREHGGRVVRFEDIPSDAVLGAVASGRRAMPPGQTAGAAAARSPRAGAHAEHAPPASRSASTAGHATSHGAGARR